MIKDIIEKNGTITPNSREIEILKANFPSCFRSDGSFDIIRFKEYLGDKVTVSQEGYELRFLGKSYAKMLAALDTETVIVPDEEHNSKPENRDSQNVYISGDNLDGLKHLLKSYAGQIKCIYIDPPYNTGTDGFVYNDNFEFTVDSLMEKLSVDEEQAIRILDLTSRGSASHSAWLMFMFSRLQLARELLSNDGVIFISIDDHECHNLKLLCDDVFGEDNFIAEFPRITKRGGKSSDVIAKNHDYLFMYSKATPRLYAIEHNDSGFKNKDEYYDERGFYKLNQTLDYDSLQYSTSLDYPIELNGEVFYPGQSKELYDERQSGIHDTADWAWRWSKDKFAFGLANGFIVVKSSRNGKRIYTKTYQKATIEDGENGYYIEYSDRTKSLSTLETTENLYSNDNATKDAARTIGKKTFDHTKPLELIMLIAKLCTRRNDIVCDFFSGSASTAEGIMKLNCLDPGEQRRYILIQLPELCKENSSAYKAGYRTICDIGMDRISKAGNLLKEEYPDITADLGFKHYTLKTIDEPTLDKLVKFDNSGFVTNRTVFDLFGSNTILTTWLIHDGYSFTNRCQMINLAGYTAYWCENHLYLINPGMEEESIKALIDRYNTEGLFNPQNIVVFGYSFNFVNMENLKTNVKILRDSEKNLKVNLDVRY